MRRLLSFLVTLVLLVVPAAGCGEQSKEEKIAECRGLAIEGRDDLVESCQEQLREIIQKERE